MTKRNIGDEILNALTDIKKGNGRTFAVMEPLDIKHIREQLDASQNVFASLMGVSIRTLQEWEQGRRKPSGSACSLLRIAQKHPDAFADL